MPAVTGMPQLGSFLLSTKETLNVFSSAFWLMATLVVSATDAVLFALFWPQASRKQLHPITKLFVKIFIFEDLDQNYN